MGNWGGGDSVVGVGGVLKLFGAWGIIQSRVFLLLCMLMNREMLEGAVEKLKVRFSNHFESFFSPEKLTGRFFKHQTNKAIC